MTEEQIELLEAALDVLKGVDKLNEQIRENIEIFTKAFPVCEDIKDATYAITNRLRSVKTNIKMTLERDTTNE